MGQRLWLAVGIICAVTAGVVSTLPTCSDVESNDGHLVIPNGTTSIPDEEYKDCDHVTSIAFNTDGTLEEIGERAFQALLVEMGLINVTIPSSVTRIKSLAFLGCSNLARVVFSEPTQLGRIDNVRFSFLRIFIFILLHFLFLKFAVARVPLPLPT